MFDFSGKVAVVTGSRRGIGRGIAEVLAHGGASVVISDIKQEDCEKTAAEIGSKYKVNAIGVKCDVTKKADVDSLIKKTVEKFKRVDIFVNNAGIFVSKPLGDTAEADWQKVMDINLKGYFLCSRAAARQMMKQKSGKIVNIASIAAIIAYPNSAAYSASKGAIVSLTREMAFELAHHGINVNAIAPGAIDTPMTSFIKSDKQAYKQTIAGIPKARMGVPADIGYAAAYLASDEADYVTGQTLVVDGGWTIH